MINFLVADDDELCIQKLRTELVDPNWKMTFSHSAENAVFHARTLKPDIILLDNHFPKLDGVDVIPLLKEYCPKAKIVMMSSFFTLKEIEKIILNQADHFILKPELSKEKVLNLVNLFEISDKKGVSFWTVLKNLTSSSEEEDIENIAIVEDDEIFSFNLQWFLDKELSKKVINTFTDQTSFFEYSKKSKPDLIFLDFNLGDGNGLDVVKKINSMDWKPKIIVVSAQEDAEIAAQLANLGVMGYIVKDHEWKKYLIEYLSILSF